MPLDSLHDLLIAQLRELFSAETQMTRALPRLAHATSHEGLASIIRAHLAETERQIDRLEEIFLLLEADPRGRRCRTMEGLLSDEATTVDEPSEPVVLDAAIVAAAQRVEHHEIAAYRSATAIADLLGHERVVRLLLESLREEIAADRHFAALAQHEVHPRALFTGGGVASAVGF